MKKITLLFLFSFHWMMAQNYTEYLTGNANDVTTNHQTGICLMGGSTEQKEAMIWFLNQADGGDVVVLRASESDGYNDYFYTELGININSVRTFVITNAAGAVDPYVLEKVANAEAIWFAGGDQYDYVTYFKDNAMEDVLNTFINDKKGVIGGTSAGLAILGRSYFSAQYGALDSDVALSNPYHPRVALGYNDFLKIPFMENVITDSHFADRNREGRMSVFLARYAKDQNKRSFGIACNDYTAVCVDAEGKATVYGDYPAYPEYAYFLQANCASGFTPEKAIAYQPLTWNHGGEALKVYKVPGTKAGTNFFDLSDWETGNGGTWEDWSVTEGVLSISVGTNPLCGSLSLPDVEINTVEIYPNPSTDRIFIETKMQIAGIQMYNVLGEKVVVSKNENMIDISSLNSGLYILKMQTDTAEKTFKIIKQ